MLKAIKFGCLTCDFYRFLTPNYPNRDL